MIGIWREWFLIHRNNNILISLQLKEKVSLLEKQLVEEQQRSEDLQFSIDEATICGEDQVSFGTVFSFKIFLKNVVFCVNKMNQYSGKR